MLNIERRALARVQLLRVRALAALMTAVALTACGGDGGDAPTPPPPPPPPPVAPVASLALKADAASTSSGGQSVGLHASLTNATGTPTWTLAGEGSLSATSGDDVVYAPPDSETFDSADTITVTATAAGLSQQVTIALQAVTVPGHRWSVTNGADVQYVDVAYATGLFVALGLNGGLATSTDGVQWTRHDVPYIARWQSIVYGATGGWVALGHYGEVMISADGVSWTNEPKLPVATVQSHYMNKLTYANGVYIAAGDTGSYSSPDGKTWTSTTAILHWTAAGLGLVVGEPSNGLVSSPDGITWPSTANHSVDYTLPASVGGNVVFGNNVFVALGSRQLSRSIDGIHWTPTNLTSPYLSGPVTFVAGVFYIRGYSSTDGLNWTAAPTSLNYMTAATTNADGSVVVAVVGGSLEAGKTVTSLAPVMPPSQIYTLAGVVHVNGRYIALDIYGDVVTSTDGIAWTSTPLPSAPGFTFEPRELKIAPDGTTVSGGDFVSDSTGIQSIGFATSANGADWTYSTMPTTFASDPGQMSDIIVDFVRDPQRWVSLSLNGEIDASVDGTTWTRLAVLTVSPSVYWGGIAYGNGTYVAVGQGGTVATSADAVNWAFAPTVNDASATPAPLRFMQIVFDGKRFVAVGFGGYIATSTDGVTWVVAASATTQDLYSLAYSPATGEFVAGGVGVLESSVDAVHWTVRATPPRAIETVTATDVGFIAIGDDGLIELSTN